MPIRLIGTIILLILVTIFAGVNLDNKCDITFVFYTFEQVPVFMTVIVSFAIGAILMLPFTLGRKKKKGQKPAQAQQNSASQNASKEESKTLFDFKIKREGKNAAKTETADSKGKNQQTEASKKPEKERKSLFGFRKKEEKRETAPAQNENPAQTTVSSASEASDDAATGAPV